jgi:hypothetical protein
MVKVFDAAAAFDVGAECQGWDEEGNIPVVLTEDGSGLVYPTVPDHIPDGEGAFFYPFPRVVSIPFLNFLRGEGGDEMRQGDYTLRRLEDGKVVIWQE